MKGRDDTMGTTIDKIDDLIGSYNNVVRREEPIIISKLRMVNDLYPECEHSSEKMFVDEIISNLADVIRLQNEMIAELRTEVDDLAAGTARPRGFSAASQTNAYMACSVPSDEALSSEEGIQALFCNHLMYGCGDKPLSTYTVNDYCLRIKNLWRAFYREYTEGGLPEELRVEETASLDSPLLNAYKHREELHCYIQMTAALPEGKKNWANTMAAWRRFEEFATKA